ncbi:MAG: GntR family transcriptional regulator [Anaerolineales bacterium]|nr:GntR family transcriptional regulator [Anaerolineales bacterium]
MRVIRSKPISEQVNTILRERIRNTTYAPGRRLPSESELSGEFGVSRATVRTVLAKLAVEGLILRKQGDGTYVNKRLDEVNTHLGGLWDFVRLIESSGFTASIEPLAIDHVTASEEDAQALGINPGEDLLAISRLFYANEKPAILARNLLPSAFCTAQVETVDGRLHIREMLKAYCQEDIAFAITDIQAALPSTDVAATLQHPVGQPLLNLKVSFYNANDKPLALGSSYFNDSILRLRLVQAWN